jgi:hypothetical protein
MDDLELTIKYNLTWDKPYSYDPTLTAVLLNGDVVFRGHEWTMTRTVAGLLNSAYNMGKMAGMLEVQNFKKVRTDITEILNALDA